MKVLTFGTFDKFHPGHVHYLKSAKEFGDTLYVLVARDVTVANIKGKPPVNSELKRVEVVECQEFVDFVYLGDLEDVYSILDQVKPNVICLGYDQKDFINDLSAQILIRNLSCKIIRIDSFKPEVYKSSKM